MATTKKSSTNAAETMKAKAETEATNAAIRAAAARVKVPEPEQPGDESPDFDSFEGSALNSAVNLETFIGGDDLAPGSVVHGELVGARLLPDQDRGGYRVVFAIALRSALGQHAKGEVVGLGERHQLMGLRTLTLGSEVMVRANGKRKLKGGRTMHDFSIKARPNPVSGARTINEELDLVWKSSGAKDAWATVAAPADGEGAPF